MTREEVIQRFEKMKADADRHVEYFEGNLNVQSAFRKTAEMYNIALSALREQEERENAEPQAIDKPLTIEELRQMDGEPVWLDVASGVWGLVDSDDSVVWLDRGGSIDLRALGGKAYRRKPKEN